jgi:hypothetical protein
MLLKLMGALPGYIYATDQDGIYVNLFIGSRAEIPLATGRVKVKQTTRYPWEGRITLEIGLDKDADFDINVRIPGWTQGETNPDDLYEIQDRPVSGAARLKINGQTIEKLELNRGYARIHRRWHSGDTLELILDMLPHRVKAHAKVEADRDRVALMRGPLVYCLESLDNEGQVNHLFLPPDGQLTVEQRPVLLTGVTVIRGQAQALYRAKDTVNEPGRRPKMEQRSTQFVAVPYYANANRAPGDMIVWLPVKADLARPAPLPTIASRSVVFASHCNPSDTLSGVNDQIEPRTSDDDGIPRFTWWDHRGTKEWVQYEFDKAYTVTAVEVYWWDERRVKRHCRVPQSWRLLFKEGSEWKPIPESPDYGTKLDQYNRVSFSPVRTSALRLEVQLQPEWSGGILEWRVEGK